VGLWSWGLVFAGWVIMRVVRAVGAFIKKKFRDKKTQFRGRVVR
jgi:hypothetical protein